MKTLKLDIAVAAWPIRGTGGSTVGTEYCIDVNTNIVGTYGVSGNGLYSDYWKTINVSIPDWVEWSHDHPGQIVILGHQSKIGTEDLCFVSCKKPQRFTILYDDKQPESIVDRMQKAIDGGFVLHYPNERGEMEAVEVYQEH